MEELISIIIPVYNSEKYISKCLKSLIKQKYNNWEAIIVNDGSSDKSQDIIENFVKKDSRFKSYYQKNSGVSSARNFGLKKVTGSYITFLDSDDEYKEDYLSKMLGSMHDNGTQLVICGFERYDLESKKTFFTTKLESQHISKSELFKKFWKYYENEVINSNCNKLYRSDIIHNYNILFNSSMKIGEDLNFNLDYLAHTEYVGIVGESLFIYNKHGSQATNKGYEKRFQDVIIYFENIKSSLKSTDTFNEKEYALYFSQEIVMSISNIVRSEVSLRKKLQYLNEIFDYSYTKNLKKMSLQTDGLTKLVTYQRKYLLFILFYLSKTKRKVLRKN